MVDFVPVPPHKASHMELLLEPILPTSPINSEESASTQNYWACSIRA